MMVTSKIMAKVTKSNQFSRSFSQSPFTGSRKRSRELELIRVCTSKQGIFMSPAGTVGRHIVFPLASVHLSVCLSVTKSCPLYNLKTVSDISTKFHTFVRHIQTTCHAQDPDSCMLIFQIIPLVTKLNFLVRSVS